MGCCKNKNKVEPMSDKDAVPPPTLTDIYERDLLKRRHSCTDVICLVIFIVCCVAQLAVSILIFVKGTNRPLTIVVEHNMKTR